MTHHIHDNRFDAFTSASFVNSQDVFLFAFFSGDLNFQFLEKRAGTVDVWRLGDAYKMSIPGNPWENVLERIF